MNPSKTSAPSASGDREQGTDVTNTTVGKKIDEPGLRPLYWRIGERTAGGFIQEDYVPDVVQSAMMAFLWAAPRYPGVKDDDLKALISLHANVCDLGQQAVCIFRAFVRNVAKTVSATERRRGMSLVYPSQQGGDQEPVSIEDYAVSGVPSPCLDAEARVLARLGGGVDGQAYELWLHVGLTHDEIARQVGVSVSTVQRRIHRVLLLVRAEHDRLVG